MCGINVYMYIHAYIYILRSIFSQGSKVNDLEIRTSYANAWAALRVGDIFE